MCEDAVGCCCCWAAAGAGAATSRRGGELALGHLGRAVATELSATRCHSYKLKVYNAQQKIQKGKPCLIDAAGKSCASLNAHQEVYGR